MTAPPKPGSAGSAPASYSPAELARRLGVSAPTIQRWVDQGRLRAWKTMGGHRRIDAASAEAFIAGQQATASAATEPAPLSVLIVDDNESDRDVLAALVEEALPQAAVRLMDNGFQALTAIGQAMPQVLITDIVMPHMNGIEMLRHVCQAGPERPQLVIAVSSYTAEQVNELGGLPDGVVRVAKPVTPAPFIELLRQVTARVNSPVPGAVAPSAR